MSNPERDLRTIIINKGLVNSNQIIIGERTEDFDGDYQVVVRLVTGNMNPKWMIDDFSFTIMIFGQDRSKKGIISDKIWEIHNALVGADNVLVGDAMYLQFNSQNTPIDTGTTQDGKPSYVSTMLIYRQIQSTNTGSNRTPLSG